MNPNESETQETWRVIAQRSSDIAQLLYQAMLEFCKTKRKGRKHGRVVNRLNAYYRYFSQYEHFSEQGCGDSLAPFGSDNVSFPLAIDALEEGLKVVVKI